MRQALLRKLSCYTLPVKRCIPVFRRQVAIFLQYVAEALVKSGLSWRNACQPINIAVIQAEQCGYQYGIMQLQISSAFCFGLIYHVRCNTIYELKAVLKVV